MSEYVDVKATGASFEGTIKAVTSHTFPPETFNYQPEALTVPRIIFEDEGQGEKRQDLTQTVLRNRFIELAPEPGTRIKETNLGKAPGKSWIDFSVIVVEPGQAKRPTPAEADPFGNQPSEPAPPKASTPPPF
jgi:hypothetical protein